MSWEHDLCRGCRILYRCNMSPEFQSDICPCVDCIIKVVCMKDCERAEKYIDTWEGEVYGFYRGGPYEEKY